MQRLTNKQGPNEKQGQSEHNNTRKSAKNESQKQGNGNESDEMPKAMNKKERSKAIQSAKE